MNLSIIIAIATGFLSLTSIIINILQRSHYKHFKDDAFTAMKGVRDGLKSAIEWMDKREPPPEPKDALNYIRGGIDTELKNIDVWLEENYKAK